MSRGRRTCSSGRPGVFLLLLLLPFVAVGCAERSGPAGSDASGAQAPSRSERKAERALEKADIAAARGQLDEAAEQYRRAAEVMPDDPRVLAGLVRVLIARDELDEAIALDDRARAQAASASRSLAPRERCSLWLAAAQQRVAAARLDAGELLDRLDSESACAANASGPVRADLLALEAERAGAAGDVESRIAGLRAAIVADPARVDLEGDLARTLLDAARRHEAVRVLSDALARHPESLELQSLMLAALGLPTSGVVAP